MVKEIAGVELREGMSNNVLMFVRTYLWTENGPRLGTIFGH